MSTIIGYIIIGLIVIVDVIGLYAIMKGPHVTSFDEEENNPYDVPRPSGRMIDKFGY